MEQLENQYSEIVYQELMTCPVSSGLENLRKITNKSKWFIVSGSKQSELRAIFSTRSLKDFFDGGIYGSPDSKEIILKREITNGQIKQPALYLGDSRYDHIAATSAGLDFIFVNGWSEFKGWELYQKQHQFLNIKYLADLIIK